MRRLLCAAALAAAGWGGAAAADEPRPASVQSCVAEAGSARLALEACKGVEIDPCIETDSGATTYGMQQCYGAEGAAWAAVLDGAVARAMEDEDRRAWLGRAQQAWTAWREAECAYQASRFLGGSLARVVAAACFSDLTAARAIDLVYAERNVE